MALPSGFKLGQVAMVNTAHGRDNTNGKNKEADLELKEV
jgi:hypothetical protein